MCGSIRAGFTLMLRVKGLMKGGGEGRGGVW